MNCRYQIDSDGIRDKIYSDGSLIRIFNNGTKEYCYEGLLHREDGPAIDYANGDKEYYCHGQPHRIGGPAIIHTTINCEYYYVYGEKHRLDGPAINIRDIKAWHYNGKYINCTTQEEFEKIIKLKVLW